MSHPQSVASRSDTHFTFIVRVTRCGWVVARWAGPNDVVHLTTSFIFNDGLADLLRAVGRSLAGEPRAEASWGEEPGEYRWIFDTAEGQTRLRVLEMSGTHGSRHGDLPGNEDPAFVPPSHAWRRDYRDYGVLVDLTAATQDVALAFVDGFSSEYCREGELGYWEEWSFPFPVDVLHNVREYLGLARLPREVGTTLRIEDDLNEVEALLALLALRPPLDGAEFDARLDRITSGAPILSDTKVLIRRLLKAEDIDMPAVEELTRHWGELRLEYEKNPLGWLESWHAKHTS